MGFPSKLWFCSMLSRVLKDSFWNRSKSFDIRKTSSASVFSLAHHRHYQIEWDVRWILSIPPISSKWVAATSEQTNAGRLPLIPRSIPSCWNLLTLNVPPLGTVTELLLKYSTICLTYSPLTVHPLKYLREREKTHSFYIFRIFLIINLIPLDHLLYTTTISSSSALKHTNKKGERRKRRTNSSFIAYIRLIDQRSQPSSQKDFFQTFTMKRQIRQCAESTKALT